MIGTVGQLLILAAFVACGMAGFAYFRAAQLDGANSDWKRIGRGTWGVMLVACFAAFGLLLYLSLTQQFQYAYIYDYTSRDLPLIFQFSATWAGQEGSFLLWILFNALVGLGLMRWAGRYEASTMAVVALCQVFLLSMVVGLKVGALDIGSSPFKLTAEKYADLPVFQLPGYIPPDGAGLNDLLQNYWMAIHPPTLFVGFAMMIVPFAFAIAALWKRDYTAWVRPALPWSLAATAVLGLGIALGGYWAYETLSFGGYWAWDPVENSSLVPWLIGIAAIHTMLVQKKSGASHKSSLLLSILAYVLVVYSTFLTRSGILGDVSVHSFVDLGLYNQLLLWILAMTGVGLGLFFWRQRELPTPTREPLWLSREFMIFSGAMLLCAVAAVVILGTSTPIIGRLFRDNPSTVPIAFYNKWTLPLTVGFVFLAGLGQLFWWNKMSVKNLNRVLMKPLAFAVVSTILVLLLTPFSEGTLALGTSGSAPIATVQAGLISAVGSLWGDFGMGLLLLLLLFVAFFALYGNGLVLWRIIRGNPKMTGGALTHIGFVIFIFGVIASSGFSKPIARGSQASLGAQNNETFVLERGETRLINGYQVTYHGQQPGDRGRPLYNLDFVDPRGRAFTVEPVVYKSNKGQWIQHPDLQAFPEKDIFVAVTPSEMLQDGQQRQRGELRLQRGEGVRIGSGTYALRFVDYDRNVDPMYLTDSTAIAVAAVLELTHLETEETRTLRPLYMVMESGRQQYLESRLGDWNLGVAFTGMNVTTGEISLQVEGVEVEPEDWVVVQAYEKPLISLVWLGILLLTFGFGVAVYRRVQDMRTARSLKPTA